MAIKKCHQHTAPKVHSRAAEQGTIRPRACAQHGGGFTPAGAPSCLLHHGTPVSTSSTSSCGNRLGLAAGAAGIGDAVSAVPGWSRDPWGAGRAALVLLGQEQNTLEQEGFVPWLVSGVPRASCTLLPRSCKSLLPQGRGSDGWKPSSSSTHVTLVLPRRCQPCPTARPGGAEPCSGTSWSGGG